ncbi:MAG: hypothetical protein L6R42_006864, partial [Xanthoria sp. 1 TBL-2021]
DDGEVNRSDLVENNPVASMGTVAEDNPQGSSEFLEEATNHIQFQDSMDVSQDSLPAEPGMNMATSQSDVTDPLAVSPTNSASPSTSTKPEVPAGGSIAALRSKLKWFEDRRVAAQAMAPVESGAAKSVDPAPPIENSSCTPSSRQRTNSQSALGESEILGEGEIPGAQQMIRGVTDLANSYDYSPVGRGLVSQTDVPLASPATLSTPAIPSSSDKPRSPPRPSMPTSKRKFETFAVAKANDSPKADKRKKQRLAPPTPCSKTGGAIDHNRNEHLEFSLHWPAPDSKREKNALIHSLKSYTFDDWYQQATSTVRDLPVLQKIGTETESPSLTVIECLIGALPSFNNFHDLESWQRLPVNVRNQLEKARAGLDIITFVIDANKSVVAGNLESLKELVEDVA